MQRVRRQCKCALLQASSHKPHHISLLKPHKDTSTEHHHATAGSPTSTKHPCSIITVCSWQPHNHHQPFGRSGIQAAQATHLCALLLFHRRPQSCELPRYCRVTWRGCSGKRGRGCMGYHTEQEDGAKKATGHADSSDQTAHTSGSRTRNKDEHKHNTPGAGSQVTRTRQV